MKIMKQLMLIISLIFLGNLAFAQSSASANAGAKQEEAKQEEAAKQYEKAVQSLNWIKGPQTVQLFNKAALKIPAGYVFLNTADAEKFMTLNQNISEGKEYILAPNDRQWFGIFRFSDDGYVKDDEKIDATAILDSIKQGTEEGNKERREKGWPEMQITGWRIAPQYDTTNKRLEWAIGGKSSDGDAVINYNTRILGRSGVTSVVLVTDPAQLDASIAGLKSSLLAFDYNSGEKYAEFKQGDKIAEYGLAALVAGGAAALAVKTGFWKTIMVALAAGWKFIAAAFVGLFSFIGRIFKGKGKKD